MFVIVSAVVSFPSPSIFAVFACFEEDCPAAYLKVMRVLAGGPAVEICFFSVSHSVFGWDSEVLVYGETVTHISGALNSYTKDHNE